MNIEKVKAMRMKQFNSDQKEDQIRVYSDSIDQKPDEDLLKDITVADEHAELAFSVKKAVNERLIAYHEKREKDLKK